MDPIKIPPADGVFAQSWSFKKILGLLAVFGPAAIVASVSIGAGETIVVVRAGAWSGYDLLWLVLLSCLVKGVFVTYLLGRYTAISGEYIGHRIARLPGPRGWLLLALMAFEMVGAPMGWVAIAKPCGDLVHFLGQAALPTALGESTWENLITCTFIGLALFFSLGMSFQRLEKQQIAICALLVGGTLVGTLLVRPDFAQTVAGTLRFGHIPDFPPWASQDAIDHPVLMLATAFGYVGGSVMAYVVYANWIGLHGWGLSGHARVGEIREHAFNTDAIDYLPQEPQQVKRLRDSVAPLRWDVGFGAVVLFVVTAAFMLSGAAVLYPLETRFAGWSLLTDQAHVWSGIHPSLVWIYYVCVIAALWGSLQALPEIYARVGQEFLQAIWPERQWAYLAVKKAVCAYLFLVTFSLIWSEVSFDLLIQIAGFLFANLAIAIIMVVALYLNFKLPAPYRTRWPMLAGAVVSAAVLVAIAGISGWSLAGKLLAL